MTHCSFSVQVQDYLDDLLPETEKREFGAHLEYCKACASELALFVRLFERLDRAPLIAPAPGLTERVLDRVLPSRIRWRWLRTLGWGYAASLSVSLVGLAVILSSPGARNGLWSFVSYAFHALVQSGQLLVNLMGIASLRLASGWGLLSGIGDRLAPLARALSTLLSQPGVDMILGASLLFSAAVLWWMRPRDKGAEKGIPHVGVLSF